jgi:hypothetical protein
LRSSIIKRKASLTAEGVARVGGTRVTLDTVVAAFGDDLRKAASVAGVVLAEPNS